jgi:hypothetical protein
VAKIFLVRVLLAVNDYLLSVLEAKYCLIWCTWWGIKELYDINGILLAKETKSHLCIAVPTWSCYEGFTIHIIIVDVCRQVRVERFLQDHGIRAQSSEARLSRIKICHHRRIM